MSDTPSFAKLVPGFEFLQTLAKNAGSAMPGIGQWVAPTLNPEELEKRISELRTVQFWLEQNARMLDATIQALEVQRMTLSTLKTMNVQMDDLRDSLKIRMPSMPGAASAPKNADAGGTDAKSAPAAGDDAAVKPGAVDPMQWWSALTNQFTQLATNAMKENGGDAAKSAGNALQKSFDSAADVFKAAAAPVVAATQKATAGFAAQAMAPVAKTRAATRRTPSKSSRPASKRAAGSGNAKR